MPLLGDFAQGEEVWHKACVYGLFVVGGRRKRKGRRGGIPRIRRITTTNRSRSRFHHKWTGFGHWHSLAGPLGRQPAS
jgi:hypothetical protein